jgi:hypothetical protein
MQTTATVRMDSLRVLLAEPFELAPQPRLVCRLRRESNRRNFRTLARPAHRFIPLENPQGAPLLVLAVAAQG